MGDILPGLRALENFHPLFVHFPLALLPLALVFQALAVWRGREDFQRLALWFLYLGTLGALVAAGSGLWAEETVQVPDAALEVIELHESLMLTTTGIAVFLSAVAFWRRRRLTRDWQIFLLVGLLLAGVVSTLGADRGGQMVYQYGVSVHQPAPTGQP